MTSFVFGTAPRPISSKCTVTFLKQTIFTTMICDEWIFIFFVRETPNITDTSQKANTMHMRKKPQISCEVNAFLLSLHR